MCFILLILFAPFIILLSPIIILVGLFRLIFGCGGCGGYGGYGNCNCHRW